jgi:hypothetical protein
MVYGPVIIQGNQAVTGHLFDIIQIPFGECGPPFNLAFHNYRYLRLVIAFEEFLFAKVAYSVDLLKIQCKSN